MNGQLMGDMADFTNETVFSAEELRHEFRMGRIDVTRAFDLGIVDERGYETLSSTNDDSAYRVKLRNMVAKISKGISK